MYFMTHIISLNHAKKMRTEIIIFVDQICCFASDKKYKNHSLVDDRKLPSYMNSCSHKGAKRCTRVSELMDKNILKNIN